MSVMPDFVSCASTLLPLRQKVAELAEASPASRSAWPHSTDAAHV